MELSNSLPPPRMELGNSLPLPRMELGNSLPLLMELGNSLPLLRMELVKFRCQPMVELGNSLPFSPGWNLVSKKENGSRSGFASVSTADEPCIVLQNSLTLMQYYVSCDVRKPAL